MRRLLIAAAVLAAAPAAAQHTETVPLGSRAYDVFSLSASSPVHAFAFEVAGAAEFALDVRTPSVPVVVEVRDPAGVALDPATFTRLILGPDDVPPLGALLFEEGAHVQVAVAAPASGTWRVTVSLPSGAPDTLGSITAAMAGGLGVSAITSRSAYSVGESAVVGVLAFDGATPISPALVTANVYQQGAEDTPLPVTLHDDGSGVDAAAGDGLYTAEVAGLASGHYLVEASVISAVGGAKAGADFEVTPRFARFNGTVSDVGVDTNFDGLFDRVELRLGTVVEVPGTYALTAVLRSDATHTLSAGAQFTLPAGATTLAVPFAAAAIKSFLAVGGPYEITEATLVRLSGGGFGDHVADRRLGLGLTQAYTLAQLQRPITIIPPGLTEEGIDNDGDGLFDFLRVTFNVDTRQGGFYTWTADLRAPDGTVLGVGAGQGFLAAGVNAVTMYFPGLPIGQSGLDGPYTVANVAAYGPFNAAAVVDEIGQTRAYLSSAFEGGEVTFARLIADINSLVITGPGGIPRATGIRKSLLQKAENAKDAYERGNVVAARNILDALIGEIQAQAGHHIAPADAERLVNLAAALMARL
ncbi:MAG TPA: choice-of-anchor X domain-containing protein [Vicinamibacteria bacterium]|nr:choice-of-anchor X domain-containing protein [Vicinamibacteria bacterium]